MTFKELKNLLNNIEDQEILEDTVTIDLLYFEKGYDLAELNIKLDDNMLLVNVEKKRYKQYGNTKHYTSRFILLSRRMKDPLMRAYIDLKNLLKTYHTKGEKNMHKLTNKAMEEMRKKNRAISKKIIEESKKQDKKQDKKPNKSKNKKVNDEVAFSNPLALRIIQAMFWLMLAFLSYRTLF